MIKLSIEVVYWAKLPYFFGKLLSKESIYKLKFKYTKLVKLNTKIEVKSRWIQGDVEWLWEKNHENFTILHKLFEASCEDIHYP